MFLHPLLLLALILLKQVCQFSGCLCVSIHSVFSSKLGTIKQLDDHSIAAKAASPPSPRTIPHPLPQFNLAGNASGWVKNIFCHLCKSACQDSMPSPIKISLHQVSPCFTAIVVAILDMHFSHTSSIRFPVKRALYICFKDRFDNLQCHLK